MFDGARNGLVCGCRLASMVGTGAFVGTVASRHGSVGGRTILGDGLADSLGFSATGFDGFVMPVRGLGGGTFPSFCASWDFVVALASFRRGGEEDWCLLWRVAWVGRLPRIDVHFGVALSTWRTRAI